MPQNLTLAEYLDRRGAVKSLTRIEAEVFGVPYPLVSGWPAKYGVMRITDAMLEELERKIGCAKQSTAEKARRGLEGAAGKGRELIGEALRRAHHITVADGEGVPIEVFAIEQATALDALTFISSLVGHIGMERLAHREGRTLSHPFASAPGALPVDVIRPYPKDQE